MALMRILYLILLVASALFYVLYVGDASFFLLAFLVLLPFVLLVVLLYSSARTKLRVSQRGQWFSRGEKGYFDIELENKSTFPIANAEITLLLHSLVSGEKRRVTLNAPVHRKNTVRLSPAFISECCGELEVVILKVKFFDLLHLFTHTRRKKLGFKAFVMPKISPVSSQLIKQSEFGGDSENFSKAKQGDDPSEIFDLREFADGDRLNRIHWKLTAKQGKTFVKEYSLPIKTKIGVMAEALEKTDGFIDKYNTQLDISASIIAYATEELGGCMVFSSASGEFEYTGNDTSEYMLAIGKLVRDLANAKGSLGFPSASEVCNSLVYITDKFDESVSDSLYSSSLAQKYTVLLIVGDDEGNSHTFNDGIITVIPITEENYTAVLSQIGF